jgi:signal transduction histidine kinase
LRNAGDELDNLIQTFNSMVERLEQSFLMTRQFSTDVSHELRTPLTAIRGQLEVALFTAATKEQYREAIITALEDVERLGQTIRAMLMSGQLVLQKAPLDLGLIIEDIVEQFQIPAEEAKLQVTAEVRGLVMMEADRIQIERMLNNLVSNAIKYTPPGGHVVVRVSVEGESVLLEVADTGVGIAPEYLPHIFDRFYRVPGSSKEKQGLGLGLSFVAWIVKAHSGTVETTSEKGKGTRFAITLPAMPLTAPYATPAMLEAGLPEAQPPTAPQAPA